MIKTKHKHKAAKSVTRCYTGPVSRNENRAAHGCIRREETCACGAERSVNVNGLHIEQGRWFLPENEKKDS